jgi:STE24 endopeptidase
VEEGMSRTLWAAILLAMLTLGLSRPDDAMGATPTPDTWLAKNDSLAGRVATTPGADHVAEVRANYTPEARSYWTKRTLLGIFGIFYTILIGVLMLATRWSARIRDVAHRVSKKRYVRVLVYFAIFSLVTTLFQLPLSIYGYVLEHQYDLSDQSFASWLGEQGKELAISVFVLGVLPLLMLAYLAIEKSPRRWWLWLALGSMPVILVGTILQPIVIDPMFNKFVPLEDQQLKAEILALAGKAEIPSRHVYQVDKSRQTKKYNAYVSGFGGSQRIVLWDTTLQGMREDEILSVMGHEMGHYKLAHIWKSLVFYIVLSFGVLYLSWRGTRWAIARFGGRWGFDDLADIASFPLLIVTISVVSLIVQPIDSGFSRMQEHEADVFSLEVTHTNDAAARAFIKLASQNKSNPEPPKALEYFMYSHPPLIDRIRFAMSYRPWEEGKPNRAFKPKS